MVVVHSIGIHIHLIVITNSKRKQKGYKNISLDALRKYDMFQINGEGKEMCFLLFFNPQNSNSLRKTFTSIPETTWSAKSLRPIWLKTRRNVSYRLVL